MTTTAQITLEEVLERLMKATEELGPLLANTTALDSIGRSLRLIDLRIGLAIRTIRQGQRLGQTPFAVFGAARDLIREAVSKTAESEAWLESHPQYVSLTSDGKLRSGQPVPGAEIAEGARKLSNLLIQAIGAAA